MVNQFKYIILKSKLLNSVIHAVPVGDREGYSFISNKVYNFLDR